MVALSRTSIALQLGDVVPGPIGHHLFEVAYGTIATILIVGPGILYVWGVRRFNRAHRDQTWSHRRTGAFLAGLFVTLVSIESVIGAYDDVLYYDHMVQHLLLVMVAGVLFAMGAPLDLLDRAATGETHSIVRRVLGSRVAEFLGHPITAFALYAVLIPVAHLTSLYNYTLTNGFIHDNEHLVFIVVGYLFWRPVVGIEPSRHPLHPALRILYLFLAVPIDTFVGLALALAPHELFSYYLTFNRPWGPNRLTDLHIGGTIMWVFGDSLMTLAMIPAVLVWVHYDEARAREVDAELDLQTAALAAHGVIPDQPAVSPRTLRSRSAFLPPLGGFRWRSDSEAEPAAIVRLPAHERLVDPVKPPAGEDPRTTDPSTG